MEHVINDMSKRKNEYIEKKGSKKKKVTAHQEQLLKQLATREIKYAEQAFAEATIKSAVLTTTGLDDTYNLLPATNSLSYVAQGDDINQRTGRKIAINSIRIHAVIKWTQQNHAQVENYDPAVRLMLVLDKTPTGTIPNSTVDTRVYTPNGFYSFVGTNGFGKYEILVDRTYKNINAMAFGGAGSFINSGGLHPITIKYKFKKPLIVNFNANANADYRQIVDNSIFLMGVTSDNSVTVSLNKTKLTYTSRIAFTDM